MYVYAGVCLAVWLLPVVTREASWVDRIWSIIPLAHMWIFTGAAGFADARLNVIAVPVTLWGARPTFNFARKGGYTRGGEDGAVVHVGGRLDVDAVVRSRLFRPICSDLSVQARLFRPGCSDQALPAGIRYRRCVVPWAVEGR